MVDWSVAVTVVMLVVEKVVWMAEKMAVKLVAPMVVMMVGMMRMDIIWTSTMMWRSCLLDWIMTI